MKNLFILCFLAVQFSFGNSITWSKTGHRTTGAVAEKYLSRKAKKAIKELLNGESLALVSTFADDIKADRSFSKFSAWHYVNFPDGTKYEDSTPSKYGDVVMGIQRCVAIVKDEKSSKEDKRFYLKMLVHLVGDLHQPMHAGRAEDKGGNDIQIRWFKEGSNLHRLWDTNMIRNFGMSYTELAANLPKITKKERKAIQEGTVYDWVAESKELATEIYASVTIGEEIGYKYQYKYWDTVKDQLQKGGLRLAQVLNDLFK